jgi:hypothetical protein
MPDPFLQTSSHSVVDDNGAGSRPQPFTSGIPAGSHDGTGISPHGPISAGNDGSTNPPLGG